MTRCLCFPPSHPPLCPLWWSASRHQGLSGLLGISGLLGAICTRIGSSYNTSAPDGSVRHSNPLESPRDYHVFYWIASEVPAPLQPQLTTDGGPFLHLFPCLRTCHVLSKGHQDPTDSRKLPLMENESIMTAQGIVIVLSLSDCSLANLFPAHCGHRKANSTHPIFSWFMVAPLQHRHSSSPYSLQLDISVPTNVQNVDIVSAGPRLMPGLDMSRRIYTHSHDYFLQVFDFIPGVKVNASGTMK